MATFASNFSPNAAEIEAQARLAAIVDCSDDAILSKDLNGTILSWNNAAQSLLGYVAAEIIGKSITCLIPNDRLAEEKMILGKLRRGIRVDHYETVRIGKDGQPIDVSISVAPLKDARGRVVGASKIIRDLTGRNKVEALLRESERRLRAIVETAVDAIITIDEKGKIESANRATVKLFGYSTTEMIGANVRMLMPEPYRGEHDGYLLNYLRTGRARIIGIGRDVTAIAKDGTTFPINLSVSEVPIAAKRLFTGIIRDLTNQRQLERRILDAGAAEQRRIGQDLHDGLCQDLLGVAFQSDGIARKFQATEPEVADACGKVSASIRAAATQARQLAHGLNPVDVGAGGLPVALEGLTVRISQSFGISCQFQWDQVDQPYDDSVATHLYRITQEAVTNAIKHGKASRIDVRLESSARNLTLTVQDNGIGLPPYLLPGGSESSAAGPVDPSIPPAGIGLQGMHYRAHLIGGAFVIHPRRGGGTIAICSIDRPMMPVANRNKPAQISGKKLAGSVKHRSRNGSRP